MLVQSRLELVGLGQAILGPEPLQRECEQGEQGVQISHPFSQARS